MAQMKPIEMNVRVNLTGMPDSGERRILPKDHCELRFDEDNGTIRLNGYAAVFNSFSEDLGGFREIIRPGAFGRSLSGNPDVRLLINHDGMPLARTTSKTLRLYEDKRGLKVDANLDMTDPDVQRLKPKMARGDMDQMSFGFFTRSDSWRTENGQDVRELHDVDLFDVSVVTFPAYPATEVGLRSYQVWKAQLQQASQEQLEAEAMAQAEARSRHLRLIGRR